MPGREDRIAKLRILAERGATEGERTAAKKALERIGQRYVEDIPDEEWNHIEDSLTYTLHRLNDVLKKVAEEFVKSAAESAKFEKSMKIMADILNKSGMNMAAEYVEPNFEDMNLYYQPGQDNIYFDTDEEDN